MKNKRIIKENHVFQKIIGGKKSLHNGSFVIYFQPNSSNEYLEYGISVGKKVGNAVVRNHVKRQVRLMVKDQLDEFGDKPFKIIILVKKNFLNKPYNNNEKLLVDLLKKI